MKEFEAISTVLSNLCFKGSTCVFAHISLKGAGLTMDDVGRLVGRLKEVLGPDCTLVVPSFPFSENDDYAAYVGRSELTFDVRSTLCRTNLFGEIFRRRKHALRSLHPIMTVCAEGPQAEQIIRDSHKDPFPFAEGTSFHALSLLPTCVLGLGVDINTGSFIHMIDDAFRDRFPYPLYSDRPISCRILDKGKEVDRRDYHYITPQVRRTIKPNRLHEAIKDQPFYRFVRGEMNHYALDLRPFLKYGKELARAAFDRAQLPLWHIPK